MKRVFIEFMKKFQIPTIVDGDRPDDSRHRWQCRLKFSIDVQSKTGFLERERIVRIEEKEKK